MRNYEKKYIFDYLNFRFHETYVMYAISLDKYEFVVENGLVLCAIVHTIVCKKTFAS